MTRGLPALFLLTLLSCASSGPAAPPLAHDLVFTQRDFEEKGGILMVVGNLTLTISPEGEGRSNLKRQILTDVDRRSGLSNDERWELHAKVAAWTAAAGTPEPPPAKAYATLTYGELKVGWGKGATLPPELADLVEYLRKLVFTLNVVRSRG